MSKQEIEKATRAKVDLDYAAIEEAVLRMAQLGISAKKAGKNLNEISTLLNGDASRPISKRRARKLEKRGEEVFKRGGQHYWVPKPDAIKQIACEIYGVPYAEVSPTMRQRAKAHPMHWLRMYGNR